MQKQDAHLLGVNLSGVRLTTPYLCSPRLNVFAGGASESRGANLRRGAVSRALFGPAAQGRGPVAQAYQQDGVNEVLAIAETCDLAGKPELASEFIKQGMTSAQVAKELRALVADLSGPLCHGVASSRISLQGARLQLVERQSNKVGGGERTEDSNNENNEHNRQAGRIPPLALSKLLHSAVGGRWRWSKRYFS